MTFDPTDFDPADFDTGSVVGGIRYAIAEALSAALGDEWATQAQPSDVSALPMLMIAPGVPYQADVGYRAQEVRLRALLWVPSTWPLDRIDEAIPVVREAIRELRGVAYRGVSSVARSSTTGGDALVATVELVATF